MGSVTLPYTEINGNPADASQVMADFNAIVNVVNGGIDSTNISGTPNFPATAITGTALTNTYQRTFSSHQIVYNPFLYGSSISTITYWNTNTNATYTANDSTVTSGVNSISDANASDTWIINQVIGTSLNTTGALSDVMLVPGKTYCVWGNVKTTSGGNTVKFTVQNASSYSGGGTDISSTVVSHTGDGTYQKIYNVFTVPASCQNITIALLKAGTTTSVSVSEVGMCLGSLPIATEADIHFTASGGFVADTNITLGGWVPANETWTYASFSTPSGQAPQGTFTITGDGTKRYSVGDKIQFTNNSNIIYGYIIGLSYSAPTTTVTYCVDSSVTVANSAITANYFSKATSPNGFPQWMNYSPILTGGGSLTVSGISFNQALFSIVGSNVSVIANVTFTTGGSGNFAVYITAPIALNNFPYFGCLGSAFLTGNLQGFGAQQGSSKTIGFFYFDQRNWSVGAGQAVTSFSIYKMP